MKLFDILCVSHDWAVERIEKLEKQNRGDDALAIQIEFYEWLDPNIPDHDVVSMVYLSDD